MFFVIFQKFKFSHLKKTSLNTGVNTLHEGIDLHEKVKSRFGECQFNVSRWRSNITELRTYVNRKETSVNKCKQGSYNE